MKRAPDAASRASTCAWFAWIAAFGVIEGIALARKRQQDTLSWHVWAWFGIKRHTPPPGSLRIRRLALLTFLAWLAAHFITGDEF